MTAVEKEAQKLLPWWKEKLIRNLWKSPLTPPDSFPSLLWLVWKVDFKLNLL